VAARLSVWLAAFWWVSLTFVIFCVVPLLFAALPTPALAGAVAAKLFAVQTWVSCLCASILLIKTHTDAVKSGVSTRAAPVEINFLVAGMLLALLVEFAVAPRILSRTNLRLWHSVGSAMYLMQWVCAAATFWKFTSPRQIN
jgi:hypothetical protein